MSDLNCRPRKGLSGPRNPAPFLKGAGLLKGYGPGAGRRRPPYRHSRPRSECTCARLRARARFCAGHGRQGPEFCTDPGPAVQQSGNCGVGRSRGPPPGGEHPTTRGLGRHRGTRSCGHPAGLPPLPPGSTSPV